METRQIFTPLIILCRILVEIKFQEISGILKANNSVDNLCRWVLVHFRFIIMAFNQSQQFDGLFSISDPIGHKQAKNAILQETPV